MTFGYDVLTGQRAQVELIQSERESSPDVVLVAILGFLDDELSVKQDETAHDEQPEVHVCLSER